ncbi:MAG: hypothetical protein CME63_16345 [Halobacteriovoraceae bacterium]|nr:hypothetical protein [Halobacteriovoraceae bacterium]|tara:strand:+ start:39599 stop:40279 length:681 start_codon:yes stop_codon:yes gene_type:complete
MVNKLQLVTMILMGLLFSSCAQQQRNYLTEQEGRELSLKIKEDLYQTKKEIIDEMKGLLSKQPQPKFQVSTQTFSKNILKKQKKVKKSIKNKTVIGRIENIKLDSTGFALKARIDTGAKTCSMHAENIIEKEVEGKKYIQFTSENTEGKKQSFYKEIVKKQRVRSSNGEASDRYVIKMAVEMGGRIHEVSVNLNDREDLRYNFLVGRNLLMGEYVVDVSQTRLLGK